MSFFNLFTFKNLNVKYNQSNILFKYTNIDGFIQYTHQFENFTFSAEFDSNQKNKKLEVVTYFNVYYRETLLHKETIKVSRFIRKRKIKEQLLMIIKNYYPLMSVELSNLVSFMKTCNHRKHEILDENRTLTQVFTLEPSEINKMDVRYIKSHLDNSINYQVRLYSNLFIDNDNQKFKINCNILSYKNRLFIQNYQYFNMISRTEDLSNIMNMKEILEEAYERNFKTFTKYTNFTITNSLSKYSSLDNLLHILQVMRSPTDKSDLLINDIGIKSKEDDEFKNGSFYYKLFWHVETNTKTMTVSVYQYKDGIELKVDNYDLEYNEHINIINKQYYIDYFSTLLIKIIMKNYYNEKLNELIDVSTLLDKHGELSDDSLKLIEILVY